MAIRVSAVPSEQELKALRLVVPECFELGMEEGKVILTLLHPDTRTPLLRYSIVPLQKPDYSGTELAALLEDLAGTAATVFDVQKGVDGSSLARIMEVLQVPVLAVNRRRPEFQVLPHKLITSDAGDWGFS